MASAEAKIAAIPPAPQSADTDPYVFVPCYVAGLTDVDVLVRFPLNYADEMDGNIQGAHTQFWNINAGTYPHAEMLASNGQIGSTWGLAYVGQQDTVYSSAYVKRKTPLGPTDSTGAIYAVGAAASGTPGAPSLYVDLNTIFGAGTAGANPHPRNSTDWNDDNAAVSQVGKVALGDLDSSLDGTKLYAVNLADRQLYIIPTSGVLDATTIQRLPIPTTMPGCDPADVRPFGLGVDGTDTLYVGAVCSGEVGGGTPRAYVWRLDGTTFTPMMDQPMDYQRSGAAWGAWNNNSGTATNFQPMLTDIDFDGRSMILSFRDRYGDQTPEANKTANEAPFPRGNGDILRAYPNSAGTWVFESNGSTGLLSSAGAGNGEGPGGGEFFFEDEAGDDALESGMGSAVYLSGLNQVLSVSYDAANRQNDGTHIDDNFQAAGIQRYNAADGTYLGAFDVYHGDSVGTTFGKASGLGDIEVSGAFTSSTSDYACIGNLVFCDDDDDGVFEPLDGEVGIDGVTVVLYDAGGSPVDNPNEIGVQDYSVVTGDNSNTVAVEAGYYLFSNLAAGDYTVRIPTPIVGKEATSGTPDVADNQEDDDNNGSQSVSGGEVSSPLIALAADEQDLTVDFGFKAGGAPPVMVAIGSTVWIDGTENGVFDAGEGVVGVVVELYLATQTPGAVTPEATAVTTTDGHYEFDNLAEGDYIVYIPASEFLGGALLDGATTITGGSTDNNVDHDDDGQDTPENGGIRSSAITLTAGTEVTGDAGYTGALADNSVNMTVDFGFVVVSGPAPEVANTAKIPGVQVNVEADPSLIIPCFLQGNIAGEALVSFPLNYADEFDGSINSGYFPWWDTNWSAPSPTVLADNTQIGTTFGVAYHHGQGAAYVSAYTKRKARFGPSGTGAIYKVAIPAGGGSTTVTTYADLNAIYGAGTAGADPHPLGSTNWNDDSATVSQVGKIALGDIDISLDESFIYAINLVDRSLYVIPTSGVIDASTIVVHALPSGVPHYDGVSGNYAAADIRPFGLGVDGEGVVYVGGVASAESTQSSGDLAALVWKFDGSAFELILNQRLDYTRGSATDWQAWLTKDDVGAHPQPMLSDIDFDRRGMILSFRDRYGDQTPAANLAPDQAPYPRGFGDVLRAYLNTVGDWALEDNAAVGQVASAGAGNGQGPGGGEFFYQDEAGDNSAESANGSVVYLAGSDQVISVAYDAINRRNNGSLVADDYNAGGVQRYDAASGVYLGAYDVFRGDKVSTTFGKANGLGDMEATGGFTGGDSGLACIGNTVFGDTDDDGLFESGDGESGIDGVTVVLYDESGNPVDNPNEIGIQDYSVVTGDDPFTTATETGYYLFSNIAPGNYTVRIPTPPTGFEATSGTPDGADNQEDNDNNGLQSISGGEVSSPLIALAAGEVDLTIDFGLKAGSPPAFVAIGSTVWIDTTVNGTFDSGEGVDGVTVELYSSGQDPASVSALQTTVTATIGGVAGSYVFDGLSEGDYFVFIPAAAFASGAPLFEFESLAGNASDDDVDNDDNGEDAPVDGGIRSSAVNLTSGSEVENEATQSIYTGSLADNAVNMTVDLGFVEVTVPEAGDENGPKIPGVLVNSAADPNLIIPCFLQGDIGGDALVSFPLNYADEFDGSIWTGYGPWWDGAWNAPAPTKLADNTQIGTTFGVAYHNGQGAAFVSAFTKRKARFGPSGTGAIYKVLIPSGGGATTVTTYADLNAIFGANTAGADPHPVGSTNWNDDSATTGQIGKIAIGDIDMSLDENSIYAINLVDRSLYVIPTSGTIDATTIVVHALPTTVAHYDGSSGNYAAADIRPFGLGIDGEGAVYVGGVASAESTQSSADLAALVWKFDGSSFELLLNQPLDYTRGGATDWQAWLTKDDVGAHPQPMLSDIDFDQRGMILSFRDRYGDQTPAANKAPNDAPYPRGFGDVLRAFIDTSGEWLLESNAAVGQVASAGAGNGQGPGGGEFFYQDEAGDNSAESANGSVVYLAESDQVVSVAYDAINRTNDGNLVVDDYNAAGIQRYSATTGAYLGSYDVFRGDMISQTFGKANGLGDMEATGGFTGGDSGLACIGNTVFGDTDDDGLFESGDGESGIDGVTVVLYDESGNPVDNPNEIGIQDYGVVTGDDPFTAATETGYYLFSNIAPGNYTVRIPTPPTGYEATSGTPDGADNQEDDDNNGLQSISGGEVSSPLIALAAGEVDLTIDFGLLAPPPILSIGNLVWHDSNNNSLFDVGEEGIDGVDVELWIDLDDDGVAEPTGDDSAQTPLTTTTAGGGIYGFNSLAAGAYFVVIPNPPTTTPLSSMPSDGADDGVDNDDNGSQPGGIGSAIISSVANLTNGDEPGTGGGTDADLTIDIGLVDPFIGNLVWYDRDGDGIASSNTDPLTGEPGIAGVVIQIFQDTDGSGLIDNGEDTIPYRETLTDPEGLYAFADLVPGFKYQVVIPDSNFAAALNCFTESSSDAVTDTSDNNEDDDDNGSQPSGPGTQVVSPMIELLVDGEPVDGSGANDESGRGADLDNGDDDNGDLTVDFGFLKDPQVAIGSTVWVDTTANGTFDASEGISGVAVELYLAGQTPGAETPVATTLTTTDGLYVFDELEEGDYIVYIPASEFLSGALLVGATTITGGSVDDNIDHDDSGLDTPENGGIRSTVIHLTAGAEVTGDPGYSGALPDDAVNMTVDFGFENTGEVAIGSVVWIDGAGSGTADGLFDDPSEGIDGVRVELYEASHSPGIDAPFQVTTTSAGGCYFFDQVPAGDYIVHIPASEFAAGSLAGTTSLTGEGADDQTDHDDNGLNASDAGGTSSVVIELAVGDEPSSPDDEHAPKYQGVLADNSVDATVDFGFDAPTSGGVAVGSRVWADDGDGIFQPGEGVSGIMVMLYTDPNQDGEFDDGTLQAMTTTGDDGFYLFDQLPAGDYVAHIPAKTFAYGPLAGATSVPGADVGVLDEDVASNENGEDTKVSGGFSSGPISLINGGQPSGESSQPNYTGTLADNSVNMTVDFAFIAAEPDPALGNVVFIDTNGNGVMDAGEGINGVAVELYTADQEPGVDPPYRNTTTVADGNYLFDLLPEGDFVVYIAEENFAPGAPLYQYQSLPGAGGDDTNDDDVDENGLDQLVNGGVISAVIMIRDGGEPTNESGSATGPTSVLANDRVNFTVDFGFEQVPPLGAIGNLVWVDENSDGYQDAGEPGIPNITVQLKGGDGNVIATTVTDSQGGYLFNELLAGDYFIDIPTDPSGMTQTPPSNLAGADFGNQNHSGDGYPVTIGGTEPWENLTADFGFNHNPDTDVNGGINTAALGDRVWIDSNTDGVQDPNEVGVSGVELTLVTAGTDGIFGTADDVDGPTTTTDANGNYLFDLLTPGAYQVRVTDSATASHDVLSTGDYVQSGDPDHFASTGSNNDNLSTAPVVLAPGDVFLNVDFGYSPGTAVLGSIGDIVWMDIDADGTQDAAEPGISGVTVALIDDVNDNGVFDNGDPVIATDTTDSAGSYLFEDLPFDNYLVWVNDTDSVLSGTAQTYDSDGPLSSPDLSAVSIASSTADLDQDFGYTPGAPLGSIGDYVWLDANSDGVQDEAGAGLGGIVLELLDHTANVVATATTSSDGYYLFDGLPVEDNTGAVGADYTVRVAALNPALVGYTNTFDPDDMTTSPDSTGGVVTLTAVAPHDRDQDFGYVTTTLGSIGDTVWFDADSSGTATQDAGEPGIPCALVSLYADDSDGIFEPNTDDALIGQQYTDSQGNYLFTDLPLGVTYFTEVDLQSLPAFVGINSITSYEETASGETTAGNSVSDATPTSGTPHITNQDFSYAPAIGATELGFIGDYIWFDADSSGGDQASSLGESGLQGVVVILKDDTGTEIARTTTDSDGYYIFIGLSLDDGDGDADYTVEVDTSTLPNYVSRTSSYESDAGTDSVTPVALSSGSPSNLDQDFSYPPATGLGAIGDYVWLDSDGAGDQNETGTGIEGAIVELLDDGGNVIASAETDENGHYLFLGLPLDESYQVQVAPESFIAGGVLEGMTNTFDSATPGDSIGAIVTPTAGSPSDLGQDFGYQGTTPGMIGNLVWLDLDADGFYEPTAGETLIAGVTVDLYRDLDGNGVIDSGEPKIGTTTTGASIVTTSTDDGNYLFEGLPTNDMGNGSGGSDYIVDVTDTAGVLTGYWHSLGTADTTDHSQVDTDAVSITVSAPENLTADFGYYLDPAKVGNYVWFDSDANGVQDSGEEGIDGVLLTLTITYPNSDTVTLNTLTGDDPSTVGTVEAGWYSFGGLLQDEDYNGDGSDPEPTYEITASTANRFPGSVDDSGATDATDSDAHSGVVATPKQGSNSATQNVDPSLELAPYANYDFAFVAKPGTYAGFQSGYSTGFGLDDNDTPGVEGGSSNIANDQAAPGDNPDGDLYDNALEYALCDDPNSGVNAKPFCVDLGTASGTVDAEFTRSTPAPSDVTYMLMVAPSIGSPPNWVMSSVTPTVTDNGNGTETVTFPDLEAQNADGIARLKVTLGGVDYFTPTFGWSTVNAQAECETISNPYAPKEVFSGTIDDGTTAVLDLSTSAGTADISAQMAARPHYIEIISGDCTGHRFEVASATADSITLDATSPRNTLSPIPDLTDEQFTLRPHVVLDDVVSAQDFLDFVVPANNQGPATAGRVLFYDSVNGWSTYFAYDDAATPSFEGYWTSNDNSGLQNVGDAVLSGDPDDMLVIIDPCAGFFVHSKAQAVDILMVGIVREWDFACPLTVGYNFIGSGYPEDQSPNDRDMSDVYFLGTTDPATADQIEFWMSDGSTSNVNAYESHFRVDCGDYTHWTTQENSSLATEDAIEMFKIQRAAFINSRNGSDKSGKPTVWTWPVPWDADAP